MMTTTEVKEDRHALLNQHIELLKQHMSKAECDDPVGIICDIRGHHAHQMAIALGQDEKDLKRYQQDPNKNPT